MKKFFAVFALTVSLTSLPAPAAAGCDEADLTCIRRDLYDKIQENAKLLSEVADYKKLDENSKKQIALLTQSNDELRAAANDVLKAAKAIQPRFYQTVEFGLIVGGAIGVTLTILAGLIIGYVATALRPVIAAAATLGGAGP